jgi:subtilisin family serine protease
VGRTSTSGAVDTNAADEVGHGTHVAGIIGAIGNNNQGVAGVVWQCKILPVRVMARQVRTSDGATTGRGTSADIAKGIRWAADQGAKIINLSLGHYSAADTVQANAVNYALGLGVLVVAAMGNDNTSKPMYPAALPGVFAVGAIDSSDQRWVHPTRANVGSNTGSHIQLVAPGAAIYNTYFDYPNSASTYAYLTGTSMATPHVAGVAAMLLSADPTKSAADLKSALTASARALPVTDPVQVGAGCVDCDAALRGYCPAPAATGSGSTGTTGTATDSSAQPAATDPAAQPATTDPAAQPAADPGASTDPGMVPA